MSAPEPLRRAAAALLLAVVVTGCGGDPPVAQEPSDGASAAGASSAAAVPTPAAWDPRAPAQVRHEVQPGDTLWDIAARHDSTAEAIVAANPVPDPDRLTVGDVLVIPTAPDASTESS